MAAYNFKEPKNTLLKKVGSIEQVAYARRMILQEGPGKGMSVVQVKCGYLDYTILLDRGMDIANTNYAGLPMSFISKTGITSPFSHDERGDEFLKGFYGGLLTTCGLSHFGSSCIDKSRHYGGHGRYSHLLADHISINCEWEDDEYVIRIKGKIRESRLFGENLLLSREIVSRLGDDSITVNDSVENQGFDKVPLMLLYHCNFGYPLLSEATILVADIKKTEARDITAQKGINDYKIFDPPTPNFKEQVFFHEPYAIDSKIISVSLINSKLGINATLSYDSAHLPYLVEWKQMGEGDYVVGLEPATWLTLGRSEARKQNKLRYLEPFEKLNFFLRFNFSTI